MPIVKALQINGIEFSKEIEFCIDLRLADDTIDKFGFLFMPYSLFDKYDIDFINKGDISPESDAVVVHKSMANNSKEVYYIKILISVIAIANRMTRTGVNLLIDDEVSILKDLPRNWNLQGFFDKSTVIHINNVAASIGPNEITGDSFDSYMTRAYGSGLCDFYDRRYIFDKRLHTLGVKVDDCFKANALKINEYINGEDKFGKKMKSALRLYYDTLMEYTDIDSSIINMATIFETLLLSHDESNQRKKVSVRTACILFDGEDFVYKEYIANYVYMFYKYRNAIVHDGKTNLDYNEVLINNLTGNIKHIIYYLFLKLFKNPELDVKDVVTRNVNNDNLNVGFDYITSDGDTMHMLFPE